MTSSDTIVAVSTPVGRGGLGVVRLSGPDACGIVEMMLGGLTLEPRHATFGHYRAADGALLDDVVATWFRAPRSATAEDVVEISAHGAPVLLQALLADACRRGARLAEPGEFTRRAFLNGKLDLTQAEAVGDLIAAHTLLQVRTAARQLQGSVAALLRPVHEQLVEVIARLEAGIDFADDDVTVLGDTRLHGDLEQLRAALQPLQDGFERGRTVREGLRLALLGRPNAGKSSLFNRLLRRERAIVTAEPGTTRDLVEESLDWEGIPVCLVDTAGIREPEGEAEQIGVQKSWQAAADADLVIGVFDTSRPPSEEDERVRQRLRDLPQSLVVWNKKDLPLAQGWVAEEAICRVSALTGEGLESLRTALRGRVMPEAATEAGYITVTRHAQQLQAAAWAVERALGAIGAAPHEALLVDLYEALHALDAITGQTTVEDILGVIFSTFCIGK